MELLVFCHILSTGIYFSDNACHWSAVVHRQQGTYMFHYLMVMVTRKHDCFFLFLHANNKCTDEIAVSHSLISGFVIRFLETTIANTAIAIDSLYT